MKFSIDTLRHDLNDLGIQDHVAAAILLFLIFTSRKMKETLSATLVGPSAGGKSTLAETVASLIPEDDRYRLSFISKAAFLRSRDFRGKLILIHEQLEDAELASAFRQLASEREVHHVICYQQRRRRYTLRGPASVVELATDLSKIDFQKRNRTLVFNIEPTPEIVAARLEQIKQKWSIPSSAGAADEIKKRHHEFQNSLDSSLLVTIPFAKNILFKAQHLHHQRLFHNILGIIATVAFLRQHEKVRKGTAETGFYIEATREDYADALTVVKGASIETGDDLLPDEAAKLFACLRGLDLSSETVFNRRQISEQFPEWTPKRVRTWIEALVCCDLMTRSNGPHNRKDYRFTNYGANIVPTAVYQPCLGSLPSPEELAFT